MDVGEAGFQGFLQLIPYPLQLVNFLLPFI